MSHFTVLVISSDPKKALAPFQENNMGDCPKEYLAFHDETDVLRKEWDETPAHREAYDSFEEWAEDWHEYTPNADGRYGYYENPNKKWDWHALGGRWTGYLLLKDGTRADTAKMAEIDWEAMRKETHDAADKDYSAFEAAYAANKEKAARIAFFEYSVLNTSGDRETFIPETREQYMIRNTHIATFAVLKDGKWHERGEMGWFACVSGEKEPAAWNGEFDALIASLGPDETVSLYDCHI